MEENGIDLHLEENESGRKLTVGKNGISFSEEMSTTVVYSSKERHDTLYR